MEHTRTNKQRPRNERGPIRDSDVEPSLPNVQNLLAQAVFTCIGIYYNDNNYYYPARHEVLDDSAPADFCVSL